MKPKNFPGRKNDRRMAALKRMERKIATLSGLERMGLAASADALALKIMPPEMARAIRTKKDRRARAKMAA